MLFRRYSLNYKLFLDENAVRSTVLLVENKFEQRNVYLIIDFLNFVYLPRDSVKN